MRKNKRQSKEKNACLLFILFILTNPHTVNNKQPNHKYFAQYRNTVNTEKNPNFTSDNREDTANTD